MKRVKKFHGALPLITALCASSILAACGGGLGGENAVTPPAQASIESVQPVSIEEKAAQAQTEPSPIATPEEEVPQAQAEPESEPAPAVSTEEKVVQTQSETATLPAATTCGLANFQSEVLRLVNEMRSASRYCGSNLYQAAGALWWNSKLFAAAAGHATEMATENYLSHTSLDGRTSSQRVTAAGYTWRTNGENIAAGQKTIADVMTGWSDSPGHCANIMNPEFTEVAVSCAASSNSIYKQYWTMSLGAPR